MQPSQTSFFNNNFDFIQPSRSIASLLLVALFKVDTIDAYIYQGWRKQFSFVQAKSVGVEVLQMFWLSLTLSNVHTCIAFWLTTLQILHKPTSIIERLTHTMHKIKYVCYCCTVRSGQT